MTKYENPPLPAPTGSPVRDPIPNLLSTKLKWLKPLFDRSIRERGDDYFRRGLVHALEIDSTGATASVAGSHVYVVELRLNRTGMAMSCTCPYFRAHHAPCKHIWAVVRKLDRRAAEDNGVESAALVPCPRIRFRISENGGLSNIRGAVAAALSFAYGEYVVWDDDPSSGMVFRSEGIAVRRNREEERRARRLLATLGFRRVRDDPMRRGVLKLRADRLLPVVADLLERGWYVEANEERVRTVRRSSLSVKSGIDWFDVRGSVEFDELTVELPEVLRAVRHGARTVRLGDGSYGLLPDDWLKRQAAVLGLGEPAGDAVRFRISQSLIVELLFDGITRVSADKRYRAIRSAIDRFERAMPAEPPSGFSGTLRQYQKEALGWFRFLETLGFGGCLADDMGLGKTVQVLAELERRRSPPETRRSTVRPRDPSLVVVPKSLLFNWCAEAARFTPGLRVRQHYGTGRARGAAAFDGCDVVLTTYGTMRNDIVWLKDVDFDYVILDEAQLVKNPKTVTSKATRLLRARRRLALSGTPIENHLAELWNLLDFLNPGIFGDRSRFSRKYLKDNDTFVLLARAVRPFILRRTKAQVAGELPERIDQTVYCTLSPADRIRYEELRVHYRREFANAIANPGSKNPGMVMLEALLRLRQAACHMGLIDPGRRRLRSAKIDTLLQLVRNVVDEGKKALVFSQFTSLLAIVRDRIEKENITYEYLDGNTADRAGRVQRFQTDASCPLFVISLKAGGLGLNLTAAEYVFLLDPWWNPAVEAQAIDRTHRIGQTRTVFAYRLITRNTVEEKVRELQDAKRRVADAVVTEDNRRVSDLTPEDLAVLLS